jgi:hypothetical protein
VSFQVIATPGRLNDFLEQRSINLTQVTTQGIRLNMYFPKLANPTDSAKTSSFKFELVCTGQLPGLR